MLGRSVPEALLEEVVEDARYAPYLQRQERELGDMRAARGHPLPVALDYAAVPGLSREMIDRLSAARPATLADASQVRGVTPAALSAVLVHSRRLVADAAA